MTVETDTDRLTMLSDFGELTIFSPGAVYPNRSSDMVEDVYMIFDAETVELLADQAEINSKAPNALARTSDVAGVERNSMVERPNATGYDLYRVVDHQPDGTGMTLLELEGPY